MRKIIEVRITLGPSVCFLLYFVSVMMIATGIFLVWGSRRPRKK